MKIELLRDKVNRDAYMVTKLMNMLKRGELRLDHPLQRDAGQWGAATRDGFIATLIKDEDVDAIKVCEQLGKTGVTLWVIDGKQRITTTQMYRMGAFKLGRGVEFPIIKYQVAKMDNDGKPILNEDGEIIYEVIEYDIRGKGYEDLPCELKERIDNYKINVVKHLNCDDEEIGYHIRRYNQQSSMNSCQSGITYMDNTAKYVKSISLESKFFRDCGHYTESEKKKGVADRVVVETIMATFHLNDWKKNTKAIGTYINDHSSQQEFDTLNEELHRLEAVIKEPVGAFNSKDTFVWLALFHKFCNLGIDDGKFIKFVDEFTANLHGKEVDGYSFDNIAVNRGTKDKIVVEGKLHILEVLMMEYLKDDIQETVSAIDFIHENVQSDINDSDMELYEAILSDLSIYVGKDSKLLEERNKPSLLAMVAFSCINDTDLDNWFKNYAARHVTYIANQTENFNAMKRSFDLFCEKATA